MVDMVGKIAGSATEKCGTLLLKVLESSRYTPNTSLFSDSAANYALKSSDNIFAHPFISDVKYPSALSDFSSRNIFTSQFPDTVGFSLYNDVLLPFQNFIGSGWDIVSNSLRGIYSATKNAGKKAISTTTEAARNTYHTISEGVSTVASKASNLTSRLIDYASSFVGRVNNDRTGNRLFSGGVNQAWCMDFVRSCLRKVYGKLLPSWFNSSRCYIVAQAAKQHNAWIGLKGSTKKEKGNFISQNIKPGDVMIQLKDPNRNSSGHTGIVKRVNSDGSFVCVEGNSHDSVREVTYQPDNKTLRGFIRV